MNRISTHVLDSAIGKPAKGIPVRLDRMDASGTWLELGVASTDQDGRCLQLLPENEGLSAGRYRIAFDTASYFATTGVTGLYPAIEIIFEVRSGDSHFHIPLLLSPNSYTTYRGS